MACMRLIAVCLLVVGMTMTNTAALKMDLSSAEIERALAIGRDRDSVRDRFHAPYILKIDNPFVQAVEVISEFRRVVINAEDQIRRGDRQSSYSVMSAQHALAPWRGQVSILVRMRFHPLNNYVGVPEVDVTLTGSGGQLEPKGILRDPVFGVGTGTPNEHLPVLGALVEASFDGLPLMDQRRRTVVVTVDGKEVARVEVDFGNLE